MILHRFGLRNFSKSTTTRCSNKIKDLLDNAALGDNKTPQEAADVWSSSPYPEGAVFSDSSKLDNLNRDQGRKARRPLRDPKESSIILFPGQGAQYVGMAKKLVKFPEAVDMFAMASDILGLDQIKLNKQRFINSFDSFSYDLLKLCNEGPQKKLDQTVYAQPAIAVTSLASLEKLQDERPNAVGDCVATAGFSLGEITALIFAGAIPFDAGVKLIQVRAEAMQIASDENPSGMATVIYGPDSELGAACLKAKEWCLERGVENPECKIASYLYPHCKVVAGSLEALNFLEKNARNYKLRKVKRLPVSGAFHSDLMKSAVQPFREALKNIEIEKPLISVHSNIDGKVYMNPNHIMNQLPKQIIKPVKWEQLLHIMYERPQGSNFPRTFEAAPGKGLAAILKQTNAKAWDTTFCVDGDPTREHFENRIEKDKIKEQQ
jgi:[acyl-carrier-protein] S-malonyltransferase